MLPEGPIQPYFTYGKVVHKIAEEYVEQQGKVAIEQICSDVLSGKIETDPNAGPPDLQPDYLAKLPGHIRTIKAYTDKIGYDGHIEWPFKYDMQPPDGHMITGVIDRLIIRGDKFFILDYKTTKKGFWRKNANTIKKDLQLRCYARVVQREFGAKPENIKAALLYLEGAELVSTGFTEESIMSAEQELHEAYKQIISTHPDQVVGRLSDGCKRCDYKKICPLYALT